MRLLLLTGSPTVYYGQRGRISAREVYDQVNACSCLTLILACIIYWQAREISRITAAPDFPFDPRPASSSSTALAASIYRDIRYREARRYAPTPSSNASDQTPRSGSAGTGPGSVVVSSQNHVLAIGPSESEISDANSRGVRILFLTDVRVEIHGQPLAVGRDH